MINVAGDDQDGNSDNSKVVTHFFHFKCLGKLFGEDEKISIKVYTKQDHKYSDDYLKVSAVACHTV